MTLRLKPVRRRASFFAALPFSLLLTAAVPSAASHVNIKFNQSGLSSIRYAGREFLNSGAFQVGSIQLQDSDGNITSADLTAQTAVDASNRQITETFAWGNITAVYTAAGNQLRMSITTTNLTNQTIVSQIYAPVTLQFPSQVKSFDGVDPLVEPNLGAPTAIAMNYGSGVLVFANDDPTKPLMAGFPWSLNSPQNTIFPLRLNTGQDPMYPTFYPNIARTIGPGESDTYQLSLRFGPATSTLASLAGDVFQSFAKAFPSTLNWNDRRAMGMLILGTSATGWATNPRGWLLDPTIDVTTPAGVAAFHTQVMQWAQTSLGILKSLNAQGMVTWDIEGEQFDQPTTYVGDPRQIGALAPEMDSIADEYFALFRNAGLKVGVCIRPQDFVLSSDGSSAAQNDAADPTDLLISKIQYANTRWGATVFYVDSNGGPNNPTDASVFQRVTAAVPNVLLIPEHSNTQYYAYTAPYLELDQGYASTPSLVHLSYPSGFSFVNLANGPAQQDTSKLITAVNQGDALMFRAWFDAPENPVVASVYQSANPVLR